MPPVRREENVGCPPVLPLCEARATSQAIGAALQPAVRGAPGGAPRGAPSLSPVLLRMRAVERRRNGAGASGPLQCVRGQHAHGGSVVTGGVGIG
jgi:hypothetical protein